MGQVKDLSIQREFLDWAVSPAEWVILLSVRLFGGVVDEETLRNHLLYDPAKPKPYTLTELGFANALKNLAVDNANRGAWLSFKEETMHQWREEAYAYGKKELRAKAMRRRLWRLDLTDKRAKRLLDVTFRGEKSGGVWHVWVIMEQRKIYWQNGWITQIDTGETDESLADLYVTPTLPASRVEGAKGFIDHTCWDYKRSFAVEVESYPTKHWDRLEHNYLRNKKMGFPSVFIVPSQSDAEQLKERLVLWKATLVGNSARFEPDHPEMVTIEVVNMLDNQQQQSSIPTETNQPYQIESDNQSPLELPSYQDSASIVSALNLKESGSSSSLDTKVVAQQQRSVVVEGLQKGLVLELAGQGWHFRLRAMRGKLYLCARQGQKERSMRVFTYREIMLLFESE